MFSADVSVLLMYCDTTYKTGQFSECMKMAEKVTDLAKGKDQNMFLSALVYKAKCLYCMYRQKLSTYELLCEQDVKKYKNIMDDVKSVVEILGMALDKNVIDDEGRKFLDIAMMNLIRGSNELNKLKYSRCMLCLRGDCKLQKSHIYPRAGLKTFSDSVERREGGKLFTIVNAPPKWQYQYWSPKTVTYFMLCSECENIINTHGEREFHQRIFLALYDNDNPQSFVEEKEIYYGPWFYHFCIGLIFRGIASGSGVPEVVNNAEVYNLFTACRNLLLNTAESESNLPTLYVFVNPAEVPQEYSTRILQGALNAPGFFTIQTEDLMEGFSVPPINAHFCVAHFGTINIVHKFSPSADAALPSKWKINPFQGIFNIPEERTRALGIPPGMWKMFEAISKMWHSHISEGLFLKKDRPPNELQLTKPLGSEVDTAEYPHIHALSGSITMSEGYLNNPTIFNVLNLLPDGCQIDYKSSRVVFPSTFVILTHHTYTSSSASSEHDGTVITLFVGLHQDKNKPIVIFCRFVAQGGFYVGFVVNNCDTLTLENLCETDLKHHPEVVQIASRQSEEFIAKYLPQSVKRKGFYNLKSVLHFYTKRYVVVLAMILVLYSRPQVCCLHDMLQLSSYFAQPYMTLVSVYAHVLVLSMWSCLYQYC